VVQVVETAGVFETGAIPFDGVIQQVLNESERMAIYSQGDSFTTKENPVPVM
jgi:hypothetical protein